jgi:hypothetical protein
MQSYRTICVKQALGSQLQNTFQLENHYPSGMKYMRSMAIHMICQPSRMMVGYDLSICANKLNDVDCKLFATIVSHLPDTYADILVPQKRPMMYGGDFYEVKYTLILTLSPQLSAEIQFGELFDDYTAEVYICNATIEM